MKTLKAVVAKYNQTSLILRILIGLAVGSVLALVVPGAGWVGELGSLFVGALKGIAPVLVFVIVASALAQGSSKLDRRFGTVIWLYMLTTFLAAAIAAITSFMFPVKVVLADAAQSDVIPQGLGEVLSTLLTNFVANPVSALMNGNYIGILFWACMFGIAMKNIGADRALDHQSGTLRHHGSGVHQRFRQRSGHLYPVRQAAGAAGGHHAVHGADRFPLYHVRLPAPQPVPAGIPLPEGIRPDRFLHPQFCRQHPCEYVPV